MADLALPIYQTGFSVSLCDVMKIIRVEVNNKIAASGGLSAGGGPAAGVFFLLCQEEGTKRDEVWSRRR